MAYLTPVLAPHEVAAPNSYFVHKSLLCHPRNTFVPRSPVSISQNQLCYEKELDPESPEYRKMVVLKYKQRQAIPIGSSPPIFTTDTPTIEDPNDEIWHEASEAMTNKLINEID
ncbi:hypothetical protein DTO027I6_10084 [Penicillium roqueforti]|nr:hypothetical protein CBS147337_10456 [Penicillium roqueforti]KAI3182975.1 hypothetical protein DTO027I6_10084 [Penicillium roqueforti]